MGRSLLTDEEIAKLGSNSDPKMRRLEAYIKKIQSETGQSGGYWSSEIWDGLSEAFNKIDKGETVDKEYFRKVIEQANNGSRWEGRHDTTLETMWQAYQEEMERRAAEGGMSTKPKKRSSLSWWDEE